MKKLLVVTLAIMMLISSMCLITSAAEEPNRVEQTFTKPESFENVTYVEFESSTDNAGMRTGTQVGYDYIFLKKDVASPYANVKFNVAEAGTYEFIIELMAWKGEIPRTSIVQVDNGAKYYIKSIYGDKNLVTEYCVGIAAELSAGEHTMTVYLADDFDDTNVKSLYFDKFGFMIKGASTPTTEAPTTEAPVTTKAPTTETPATGDNIIVPVVIAVAAVAAIVVVLVVNKKKS